MARKLTIDEFIRRSKSIHKNKYDYSKSIYVGSKEKIIIKCPIHGEFLQKPNDHLNNHGCWECRNAKMSAKYCKSTNKFIKDANKIHNKKFIYSKSIYKNAYEKIIIICPSHGQFLQVAHDHLRGNGCPKCKHFISNPEKEFIDHMKISPKYRQVYICGKRVDGLNHKSNTIYEFLGDYYHGNPKKYKPNDINTTLKNKTFGQLYKEIFDRFKKLNLNGYNIKYIWEMDWNKFKKGIDIKPNILIYE